MLTRIEIDGFKSFENFSLDFGPLAVIFGPNASGKSNLFDAIKLLSRIAKTDLRTALQGLRGEPIELFRLQPDGSPVKSMSFAVELLLAPKVRDLWGETMEITHSRVRYEVEIELQKETIAPLVVTKEIARPILASEDLWRPKGQIPSAQFQKSFIKYSHKDPWLTLNEENGKCRFKIDSDRSPGRVGDVLAAESTILSRITSAEFPHLYALREELLSWRFIQLDPRAIRRPSSTTAPLNLEPDGSNMAAVLVRIKAETATDIQPKGVLADIVAEMTHLIPGAIDVRIEEDRNNREYRLFFDMRDGFCLSSRVVSDGTLRVLALLTLLYDPQYRGLVCFEEPENGINPLQLKATIQTIRELTSDPFSEDASERQPLSQLLLNSHSPILFSCLEPGEAMFADAVSSVKPQATKVNRKTRIRSVTSNGQVLSTENQNNPIRYELERYFQLV